MSEPDSPSEYEIRYLAYELWEKGGRPDGEHLRFWEQAECQIKVMQREREQALDQGLEDSSPASDPPSEVQPAGKE